MPYNYAITSGICSVVGSDVIASTGSFLTFQDGDIITIAGTPCHVSGLPSDSTHLTLLEVIPVALTDVAWSGSGTVPAFIDYAPPDGNIGVRYPGYFFRTNLIPAPPAIWATGQWPQGLNIGMFGAVAGIPTESGDFLFSVNAWPEGLAGIIQNGVIHILPDYAGPGLHLSIVPLIPSGTVSQAFSAQLTGIDGTGPYTYAADVLPAGVTLDSATGALSGIPTEAFDQTVTFTVTDSLAATATLQRTIVIAGSGSDGGGGDDGGDEGGGSGSYPIPVMRSGLATQMAIAATQALSYDVTARFYKNGSQIGHITLPAGTPAFTMIASDVFLYGNLAFAVGDVLTRDYSTSDGTTLPAGVVGAGVRWNIDRAARTTKGTTNLTNAELSGVAAAL